MIAEMTTSVYVSVLTIEFYSEIPRYPACPEGDLENAFISEYLAGKGYTHRDLRCLSREESNALMIGASIYASTHLAEIETRSQLVRELHQLHLG